MIPVEIQESSPRFQNFVAEESIEEIWVNLDPLYEVREEARIGTLTAILLDSALPRGRLCAVIGLRLRNNVPRCLLEIPHRLEMRTFHCI